MNGYECGGCDCDPCVCEEVARKKKIKEGQEKLEKLKQLGEKYSKVTEFFDVVIANDFVELPYAAKKLINQIGNRILEIIDE